MSTAKIRELLGKFNDFDKDERYMAISDLQQILRKGNVKIENSTERMICDALLDRLGKDKSNDVQTIAVACISEVLQHCRDVQVSAICQTLCSKVVDEDSDELRDIYSIGLKTLIKDVPRKMGSIVTRSTVSKLIYGLRKHSSSSLKCECLDLLSATLSAFGSHIQNEHGEIMKIVLEQIDISKEERVQKRAINCIGALANSLSDASLNILAERLLMRMRQGEHLAMYVRAVGMIAHRIGKFFEPIAPILLKSLGSVDDESMLEEEHCVLRENCLNAFASFVAKCPDSVRSFVPKIVDACVKFMRFDPNYDEDDDDAMDDIENGDEAEEEEEEEDAFDDEFGDDDDGEFEMSDGGEFAYDDDAGDADDISWRVRKAAINVLKSLACSDLLGSSDLFGRCTDALLRRFKERAENVRLEIIECFYDLLKLTAKISDDVVDGPVNTSSEMTAFVAERAVEMFTTIATHVRRNADTVKTRMALFDVVGELFNVLKRRPDLETRSLSSSLPTILPLIMTATHVSPKNSPQLRLCAIELIDNLLIQCPSLMIPFLSEVLPLLVTCVGDDWYRLVSGSLNAVVSFIGVLRASPASSTADDDNDNDNDDDDKDGAASKMKVCNGSEVKDVSKFVVPLYDAILPRLRKRNLDLEIKQAAIRAASLLLARIGEDLTSERKRILKLLSIRMKNDTTRMVAIRGVATVARSGFRYGQVPELAALFHEVLTMLSTYFKQHTRPLKLASMECLLTIVRCSGVTLNADGVISVCSAASLINNSDLHASHLALDACRAVLVAQPKYLSKLRSAFWMPIQRLLRGPMPRDGPAQKSIIRLLRQMVQSDATFADRWLDSVLETPPTEALPTDVLGNLGRAVAVVTLTVPKSRGDALVARFVEQLVSASSASSSKSDSPLVIWTKLVLLTVLGEIGRIRDLSRYDRLCDATLACASNKQSTEAIRIAAARALGSMAVGSIEVYLPIITKALKKSDGATDRYLILVALRSLVLSHRSHGDAETEGYVDFRPHVATVLPLLSFTVEKSDESMRDVIAECLGCLTRIDATRVVAALAEAIAAESESRREVAALALKFAASDDTRIDELDRAIRPIMKSFFDLLKDKSLRVVESSLIALNAIAHHRPSLLRPLFAVASEKTTESADSLWPLIFDHMIVKKHLKRTINLGPFKEKIDDGLPIRKAAFTCVDTMLKSMPTSVDIPNFVPLLKSGLSERDAGVKMVCYSILRKICARPSFASKVVPVLGDLLRPLDRTIKKRASKSTSKESADQRQRQLLFTAVRVVEALSGVSEVRQNETFKELWEFLEEHGLRGAAVARDGGGDDDAGKEGSSKSGGFV